MLQQIPSPPPIQAEVIVNRNFEAVLMAGIYGQRHSATAGLIWGYYGGFVNSVEIADGTVTLTNSTTNYVVARRSTGLVSTSTATTNWNARADFRRLYKLVTSGGLVTDIEDHRFESSPLMSAFDIGSPSPADGDVLTWQGGELLFAPPAGGGGGDASTNTATSVDSELVLFSGTTGKELKRATGTGYAKVTAGVLSAVTTATAAGDLQGTGLVAGSVGFREIPQNAQSGAYTCVAADSGKHIHHPAADTTPRAFTIPANSSVAYPIGTALTFTNEDGAGTISIAITTDTMRLAGVGSTGTRTLASDGTATAIKITATKWLISGTGLT